LSSASRPCRPLPLRRPKQESPPSPPYVEAARADADVAKALARAKAHHRRLLVDLGGNWCGDCRILAATMELPALRAFIAKHYEVVAVDVGRFDRNLQVPARYGLTQRLIGVPTLLVIDPKTDALINRDDVFALSSAGEMSPQALADWFGRWAK
jgi:thiol-disulfide isomerase/thioredoxin